MVFSINCGIFISSSFQHLNRTHSKVRACILVLLTKISSMSSMPIDEYRLVEKREMENFMERCMLTVGTKPDHAKSLAACLIAADHRGHFSHGLNRLGLRRTC